MRYQALESGPDMATCWNCEGQVPEGVRYCPHCANSQVDGSASPLFIVDPVTGLFNQDFLQALSDQETNRAGRYHRPLSLLVAEVDHAEFINDDLRSPEVADLLRQLGAVLVGAVRDTDTVCAMPGSSPPRFGVVLPETDYEGALNAADKIRRAVASHEFETAGQWSRLTMSCGTATIHHERIGKEDLLATALAALDAGRAAGPNRTHAVSPL
jgi:diguanylate cyclase (GGDEF)-like protein